MNKIILSALLLGISPAMASLHDSENLLERVDSNVLNNALGQAFEWQTQSTVDYLKNVRDWGNLPFPTNFLNEKITCALNSYEEEKQKNPDASPSEVYGMILESAFAISFKDLVSLEVDAIASGDRNGTPLYNIDAAKERFLNHLKETRADFETVNFLSEFYEWDMSISKLQNNGITAFDHLSENDQRHVNFALQFFSGYDHIQELYEIETLDDIHHVFEDLLLNRFRLAPYFGYHAFLWNKTIELFNQDRDRAFSMKHHNHFFNVFNWNTPKHFFNHTRHTHLKDNVQSYFNEACSDFLDNKKKDLSKIIFSDKSECDKRKDILTWWRGKK